MNLEVSVGYLAAAIAAGDEAWVNRARAELDLINGRLAAHGLPAHQEPEVLPADLGDRPHISSFPHSRLYCLRRFAANVYHDPDWVPTPVLCRQDLNTEAWLMEAAEATLDQHLLIHADDSGYYVPIDFRQVIFDREEQGLPGCILGSSIQLQQELQVLAPYLNISLNQGWLSDEEADQLFAQIQTGKDPFESEKLVWLALFEQARLSIEHGTAIRFS